MGINTMNQPDKTSAGCVRHYYNCLNAKQQKGYRTMLRKIKAFSKRIVLPIMPINEISLIYNGIMLDNPLIFYVGTFSYMKDLYKRKCIIMPEYRYKRSDANVKKNAVTSSMVVFNAVQGKSDYEKVQFVHDYCLSNISYDYSVNEDSHSILGAVLNNTAGCDGIAKFVKLALDYLGVRSLVVSGRARSPLDDDELEAHAWSIVQIVGNMYHLDVTFDLTLTGTLKRYDYFNLSDREMSKDHTISSAMPACTTSGKDYFSVNSLVANSPADFERLIEKRLRTGERSIAVKLLNTEMSDKVQEKITKIAQRQFSSVYKRGCAVEVNYNASQMVFEINFR